MKNSALPAVSILIPFLFIFSYPIQSQYITKYPEIPRIDVHTHIYVNVHTHVIYGIPAISSYLSLRDQMVSDRKIDLAMLISLGGEEEIDSVTSVSKGRIMTCISDYTPQRGLTHKASDIAGYLKKGYAGYKIIHGPYYLVLKEGENGIRYIDDPAHEPVFKAMEKAGMIGASIHIADPNGPFGNRGKWCTDPVEFWREIMGLERVLQRHPDLVIVASHCSWLVCQDAQLDFLRYLLKSYPNLYVDLAATDQYYHLVNRENLRDLFIEYSDRILFGTDIVGYNESAILNNINRYARSFQILETEDLVESGFFGSKPTRGLNLPEEALENIYYRNAMKLYPGLSERMISLGYGNLAFHMQTH